MKEALADATVLAAPNEGGRFVLHTYASAVAIAESYIKNRCIKEKPSFVLSFMVARL